MAHSLSAKKRVRQNEKRNARNRWRMKTLKETLKAFEETILHGKPEAAAEAFRKVASTLDKTAQNGVIHKNTASRKKSRLSARLKLKQAGKVGSTT
ncbi:MAG: 30S ribosomal protein S20 [Phycisphaerales bacterium]|nr:30S ribosomal protein S20 [Phycisphaerales bacterium]